MSKTIDCQRPNSGEVYISDGDIVIVTTERGFTGYYIVTDFPGDSESGCSLINLMSGLPASVLCLPRRNSIDGIRKWLQLNEKDKVELIENDDISLTITINK